jgi:patatin-like phospholipase/acyl hydrolase
MIMTADQLHLHSIHRVRDLLSAGRMRLIESAPMPRKLPLRAIRVHLTGSVHSEASDEDQTGILSFAEKFTAAVLTEGGTLIHGSHSTLLKPLEAAALAFVAAGGSRDALTLVRSYNYSQAPDQLTEIAAQREFAAVQVIPSPQADEPGSLISMRDWMAGRCDVVVAIGGKWWKSNRDRAGVPGEFEEALRRGKPGFAVAGFGGAIRGYLEDDTSLLSRLRNGLSENENRNLATSRDIDQLVTKIVSQIKLLPLVREDVRTGRLFRILALDGGGIRGTFSAAVLAKWDDMLGKGGNNALIKHFDLVTGTSTGAILAIGLGLGKTPKEMLEFYKKEGPKIFPKNRALRHWLKSKHDSQTLRQTLESHFGGQTLTGDSCCRLVIPTVRANHGESEVIVTAHTPDRVTFRDISAVDAALASSAAPTYFDDASVDDSIAVQSYLDGGIWANNPVLPAIAEAVRHLQVPLDRLDVLSVGTMGNEVDFCHALAGGKIEWATSSTDLFFAAQEHAAATLADSLLTRARHLRVNQRTPMEIPLDDTTALTEMARRGDAVASENFIAVRSRFLDGFHAQAWRAEGPR